MKKAGERIQFLQASIQSQIPVLSLFRLFSLSVMQYRNTDWGGKLAFWPTWTLQVDHRSRSLCDQTGMLLQGFKRCSLYQQGFLAAARGARGRQSRFGKYQEFVNRTVLVSRLSWFAPVSTRCWLWNVRCWLRTAVVKAWHAIHLRASVLEFWRYPSVWDKAGF